MSDVTVAAKGGREAAIAHRKALSSGKSAVPAPERVRGGAQAAVVEREPFPAAPVAAASPEFVAAPPAAPPSMPAAGFVAPLGGGRAAAIQHRRQLSSGKVALGSGATPAGGVTAAPAPPPSVAASGFVKTLAGGREASIQHRRQLSSGKSALLGTTTPAKSSSASGDFQPATGRLASVAHRRQLSAGKSGVATPAAAGSADVGGAPAASVSMPAPSQGCAATSCKDQSRARRAAIAIGGRTAVNAPPAGLTVAKGVIVYPSKVTESGTQGGQRVTGIRIGEGRQVTGDERGTLMPVSGTSYIDTDGPTAFRAAAPKVGLMRTQSGQTVSGTLVRSQIRITGDERGGTVGITGKVDPHPDDDMTVRSSQTGSTSAQFQRQSNPHGSTVFGTNLGRSSRSVGSRDRSRAVAIETTDKGQAITGSALGHSSRMTGDETGACRTVTGNQYLAPARAQAICGAMESSSAGRNDPVTANKVSTSESWGGQRITGMDVEHNPRVTGDEPGSCSALTGSQYQGRSTADGWCDPASAGAAASRRARSVAGPVTGNTPLHYDAVTGTARGAGRDITGTPYQAAQQPDTAPPADPVATLDTRFSVRSPQRAAHLQAASAGPAPVGDVSRITGSFAVGGGKVTGNMEFMARPRAQQAGDKPAAHNRVSGEGIDGGRISGDAWGAHRSVTGTDGAFAADRNPSQRGPKAKAFAGSTVFKSQAVYEEPKQLVTGMFYFAKSGARVTLSGGAQG
jgi:hypothetical protein